jgi:hypothetical protein
MGVYEAGLFPGSTGIPQRSSRYSRGVRLEVNVRWHVETCVPPKTEHKVAAACKKNGRRGA